MTSSQMAVVLRGALMLVAALLFTSAQLRVLKGSVPRTTRYAVAWLIVTIVLGGFISYLDVVVGRVGMAERLSNFVFAGVSSALALGAGARLGQSPFWQSAGRSKGVVALLAFHALIVWLLDSVIR